jgi:hypothetical protein
LESPASVYASRVAERQQAVARQALLLDRIGLARVTLFGALAILGWLAFVNRLLAWFWLLPLAIVFLALFSAYDRIARRRRWAERAVRFYTRGLERLTDQWSGSGETGQRFLDEAHPYAADLDLFGTGSLFQRLCTCRTRMGENTLANWLRNPAGPDEVRARQEAVADLRPRLDLREDLALLGAELPGGADFAGLVEWGTAPPVLLSRTWRRVVAGLGFVNLATLSAWPLLETWIPFVAALVVSGLIAWRLRSRVRQILTPIERAAGAVGLLAGLLERLEREAFTAPRLAALQAALRTAGQPPSRQIADLARLVELLHSQRNQFFAPLAILLLWNSRMALAFEVWRARTGPHLRDWLTVIGDLEALSTLAAYAYENPADPFPEVAAGPVGFEGIGLGHPLLPAGRCVPNDVSLVDPVGLLIVSGSNMSGKSTLLRTVGINVVLALAGAPVRAQELWLSPVALGATLRVQDSLLAGRSRFFAEITRIRQLVDLADGPLPLLFLLDEIFHGTNSHDRRIGAEGVLRRLLDAGASGLVTTHDLALTQIAEQLAPRARNVHFADQFTDGALTFDYRVRPGVVPHSNALALMRAVGLDV